MDEVLAELWRRDVFIICVSNMDDYLRNHGFNLTKTGWTLSPAFDIKPIETGGGLKLNISDSDNALNLDLAPSIRIFFCLRELKAKEIMYTVKAAVGKLRTAATK